MIWAPGVSRNNDNILKGKVTAQFHIVSFTKSCSLAVNYAPGSSKTCVEAQCFVPEVRVYCRLTPMDNSVPHNYLLIFPWWDVGENWSVKGAKLVIWDKDNFTVKQNLWAQAKQNKECTHHFPWAGRSSPTSRWWEWFHHTDWWLGKTNTITRNVPCFLLLPPVPYAEHGTTWYGTVIGSVRDSSPGCVPSSSLCTPSSLRGGWGTEKPWPCVSTDQPWVKIPVVL